MIRRLPRLPDPLQHGIIDPVMHTEREQKKRPARLSGWPQATPNRPLGVSAHCLDALGAQRLAHTPAVLGYGHALDVGLEPSLCSHVRVAHAMPETRCLATSVTPRHGHCPQSYKVKATRTRSPAIQVYHNLGVHASSMRRVLKNRQDAVPSVVPRRKRESGRGGLGREAPQSPPLRLPRPAGDSFSTPL